MKLNAPLSSARALNAFWLFDVERMTGGFAEGDRAFFKFMIKRVLTTRETANAKSEWEMNVIDNATNVQTSPAYYVAPLFNK